MSDQRQDPQPRDPQPRDPQPRDRQRQDPQPRDRVHDTVLLDVDGTLVDSTYHHAIAWHRAFRDHGITVPMWRVHRAIGMGGDRLVGTVAGDTVEDRLGDQLRQAWEAEYDQLLEEVEPLPGAHDLVALLKDRGFTVALGSSGKPDHTRAAVDLVGVADLVDAVTTSEDVDTSKPAPDILQVALERSGGSSAIVVGDSTYDVTSAARMHAPCVAIRTGGFGADELEQAGAVLVADGLRELCDADWEQLARTHPPARAGEEPPPP